MDPQAQFRQAVSLHRQGKLAEAQPLYRQLMTAAPENFPTRYMFALLCHQLGHNAEALEAVQTALKFNPASAEALALHGVLLQLADRPQEALASFDTIAAQNPGDAANWFNRGTVLQSLNRQAEALASFDRSLALKPDHAEAWYRRGAIFQATGHPPQAVASYDRCLALRTDHAQAWSNRGAALMDLKRPEEALASLDQALALAPGLAQIWHNRGMALRDLARPDEALASYDQALALDPNLATSLNNRSAIHWKEKRNYEAAVADLERVVQLAPDYDFAQGLLLHQRMHGGDWRDFDTQVAAVNDGVRAGKPIVQPFVYQAISTSPADLQKCSTIYADRLYPAAPPLALKGNRSHRKIRLGYMSGEMRAQAIGYLMVGVFEHHDKNNFELVVLDNGWDDASATRKRIEAAADKVIDITRLSNPAAAERIRDEEIDILVNLNGYFGAVRMEIFAGRPAPIQVNYLGLPATLGARYIDYIIADQTVIPDAEQRFYTESVVHLPDTYWPTDNRQAIADTTPTRSECGLPADGFVFCNFNQSYKLTPGMFSSWCRILDQVPGSVLWLMDAFPVFSQNLRREAEARGIAGERLIFGGHADLDKHLARLKLADLSLDSLPYNEHTTGCDVLWAGVPLLTCRGTTFPGRVAASMLVALGLPELITENPAAYESLAVALARDPARLTALRQKLAQQRLTAPLFDTARFTRNLEAAYSQMWQRWRNGESPSPIKP